MRHVFALAVVFASVACGQAWVVSVDGGIRGNDAARALRLDGSGNVYVTGTMSRTSNTCAGTCRLDPEGRVVWLSRYEPNPGFDHKGIDLALDAGGGTVVASASRDSSNVWCYALVKYDRSGREDWAARYSSSAHQSDYPRAVAALPDGSSVVTGESHDSAQSVVATVCWDSTGGQKWVARYNGPGGRYDEGYAVTSDSEGCVYVAGYATDQSDRQAALALKYDSAGHEVWVRLLSFAGYEAFARNILVDRHGYVYLVGTVGQRMLTAKLNPGGETLWTRLYYLGDGVAVACDSAGNVLAAGTDDHPGLDPDMVLVKYDSLGNRLWDFRFDGPDGLYDECYDLASAPDGAVYVCGYSQSQARGLESILIKYRSGGDTAWTARVAGYQGVAATAYAAGVDIQGNVVIAGDIYTQDNGYDYLVAKYPPSGPGIVATPTAAPAGGARLDCIPSIVRTRCAFDVRCAGVRARLVVSDIAGRLVRTFDIPPESAAGSQTSVVWDACDEQGRRVADGVYFVTLESSGVRSSAKVIVTH